MTLRDTKTQLPSLVQVHRRSEGLEWRRGADIWDDIPTTLSCDHYKPPAEVALLLVWRMEVKRFPAAAHERPLSIC